MLMIPLLVASSCLLIWALMEFSTNKKKTKIKTHDLLVESHRLPVHVSNEQIACSPIETQQKQQENIPQNFSDDIVLRLIAVDWGVIRVKSAELELPDGSNRSIIKAAIPRLSLGGMNEGFAPLGGLLMFADIKITRKQALGVNIVTAHNELISDTIAVDQLINNTFKWNLPMGVVLNFQLITFTELAI